MGSRGAVVVVGVEAMSPVVAPGLPCRAGLEDSDLIMMMSGGAWEDVDIGSRCLGAWVAVRVVCLKRAILVEKVAFSLKGCNDEVGWRNGRHFGSARWKIW